MLNVTHYDWTAANIKHGLEISRLTGGKHFIINTSENGRGPVHYRRWISRKDPKIWRRVNVWCHAAEARPRARLRRPRRCAPTSSTPTSTSDRPGYSAGSCNGGPLPIGSWWADRALDLARHATEWVREPAGHSLGWPRGRYTIQQLAGDQYIP